MENDWKMVVGETSYNATQIEKIANDGTPMNVFLNSIQTQRDNDLFYADGRDKRWRFNRKNSGLHELEQCLNELGYGNKIERTDDLLYFYYKGKENKVYLRFFETEIFKVTTYYSSHLTPFSTQCLQISCFDKEDIKALLLSIPQAITRWEAENKMIKHIFDKVEKNRALTEISIKTMVDNALCKSGYDYKITKERTRLLLSLKMNRQRQLEISLPHKDFQKHIDILYESIEKIMITANEIPLYFKIIGLPRK